MPSISLVAPLNGGEMPHVEVRHQDIGVAPAVVGISRPRFAIDIIGFAPRQTGFFKADHQAVMSTISEKNNPLQSVIMEIIANVVDRVMVRGQRRNAAR